MRRQLPGSCPDAQVPTPAPKRWSPVVHRRGSSCLEAAGWLTPLRTVASPRLALNGEALFLMEVGPDAALAPKRRACCVYMCVDKRAAALERGCGSACASTCPAA
eukprot:358738-Chlamydomonas_euryale.AAC.2